MLTLPILCGLMATFVLVCLKKWGLLDLYEATRPGWMPAGDCYFCLGFWIGTVQMILLAIFEPASDWQLIPPCAAVITLTLMTHIYRHD